MLAADSATCSLRLQFLSILVEWADEQPRNAQRLQIFSWARHGARIVFVHHDVSIPVLQGNVYTRSNGIQQESWQEEIGKPEDSEASNQDIDYSKVLDDNLKLGADWGGSRC